MVCVCVCVCVRRHARDAVWQEWEKHRHHLSNDSRVGGGGGGGGGGGMGTYNSPNCLYGFMVSETRAVY